MDNMQTVNYTASYDDKTSLYVLRSQLNNWDLAPRSVLLVRATAIDLMKFRWPLHYIFKFYVWREQRKHGFEKATGNIAFAFYNQISRRDKLETLWQDMMVHMTDGKDLTDPKSAGGWNSFELKDFLCLVNMVNQGL